jgi:malectin (di-glucose binding ER protein)
MAAPENLELAKNELESVLHSGLFAHAPSLAQFLTYVCAKSFEGKADQIKEYNIAVEALGRKTPEYDQKKDSIVRVEAHRLRKRLHQYYASEGANHALQILIPPGQYVPKFVAPGEVNGNELEAAGEATPAAASAAIGAAPTESKAVLLWAGASVVILVAAILIGWRVAPNVRLTAGATRVEAAVPPTIANAGVQEIRILAGSTASKYVDRLGNIWTGDRFFNGGAVFSTPPGYRITGTQDPAIFQSRREGVFGYDIPLEPGIYELHLYFAETLFGEGNIAGGGDTYRIFNIRANGKLMAPELDVIADTPGPNTADVKVYKDISPASDGFLHLKFDLGYKEKPFLNAIEIVPGIRGRLRPVRIVARETPVNSKDGRLWEADHYFIGGQRVLRTDAVRGTTDPDLYRGERYGNFTYSIPVTPGRYTVNLRFAESWFGPRKPAGGGAGERIFDVYANGVALLRNFDIFKEAGGEDRPLDKVFHAVQSNAQGKLVLSFVPVRNYACVNAIEVLDEGSSTP